MTAPVTRVPERPVDSLRQLRNVLASEACKLRSLRSTTWALLAAIAFNVGLAAVLAIFLPGALGAHARATLDTTRVSLGGLHLSQLACGLIGVLAISSEYTSGLIRTTLSGVPNRRLVLAVKTLVLAATVAVVATASCPSQRPTQLRTAARRPSPAHLAGRSRRAARRARRRALPHHRRVVRPRTRRRTALEHRRHRNPSRAATHPATAARAVPASWKTAATTYTPLQARQRDRRRSSRPQLAGTVGRLCTVLRLRAARAHGRIHPHQPPRCHSPSPAPAAALREVAIDDNA